MGRIHILNIIIETTAICRHCCLGTNVGVNVYITVNTCSLYLGGRGVLQYTVPKVIDFPRYNMKCSRENVILRGIFHEVSRFPLHIMLYSGNLDYIFDSVHCTVYPECTIFKNLYCLTVVVGHDLKPSAFYL